MLTSLFIVYLGILNVGAVFPPSVYNNTSGFYINPHTYQIILSSNNKYVGYVPITNGNRLRLVLSDPVVFSMYVVNDGYTLLTNMYKDVLCLTKFSSIRVLTYPRVKYKPQDCIVYFDRVGNFSVEQKLKYKLGNDNKLCIDQSDIEPNVQYRLYIFRKKKYYIVIGDTLLTSTDKESKATIFTVKYTPCIEGSEMVNDSFVCRILNKASYCQESEQFVKNNNIWLQEMLHRAHFTKLTIRPTTVNNTKHTLHTTTTPYTTVASSNYMTDYVMFNIYSEEHFWCEYVDVLCAYNASVKLNYNNFMFIIFIIYICTNN